MRVLNLYAGLGGNRKYWDADVTAVEFDPKIANIYREQYPDDDVYVEDAHKFLLGNYKDFDFIWSSPPCQTHSKMSKATRHKLVRYPDLKLYEEIMFLDEYFDGDWVVENVVPYYKPLITPDQQVGRHLFWSSYYFMVQDVESPKGFITAGTVADTQKLKEWLGIHYEGNIYYGNNHCPGQVLRNCVHPDIGRDIYWQAPIHDSGQCTTEQ